MELTDSATGNAPAPRSYIVPLLLFYAFASATAQAALPKSDSDTNQIAQVSIATVLTEVQRGTFDGRDFLTLHIAGKPVGPSSCRSNILRMDASGEAAAAHQENIETIALSAILRSDTVMIVVPLDTTQCVDGKPTFTDLYILPAKH